VVSLDLFSHFREIVIGALKTLSDQGHLPQGLETKAVALEPPRDPAHGDMATNAAMVLAKQAGMKPRDIAELLVVLLNQADDVESAEIAGPGFINLRLEIGFWPKILRSILAEGENFGSHDIGQGTPVNVEYVSANPTGPMHVGHCRGAVFGDALANLLEKVGFNITREYYINDDGAQVDALARSTHLRYREALGEDIGEIPQGLYPGDYLKPVGADLAQIYGRKLVEMPEEEWLPVIRLFAVDAMMVQIRSDLEALNIHQDVFFSERSLTQGGNDKIAAAIEDLRAKDLIYQGTLPPPKGQLPEEWEDREQTLFKSTNFGDDVDRPLMKSDGRPTYFASDIAYHKDKIERGFNELIDVWGADHGGYVKRMQSAVTALSDGQAHLEVKLCQLVRLMRGGELVKMSKRSGEFITLRDVVNEVGRNSVRFMMLYRKNDASLDFDFEKVSEQSRDNPVFYVQYAYARIHSVLRNAGQLKGGLELSDGALATSDMGVLSHPSEIAVIKHLAQYPRVVRSAASTHEPHRIAFYLYDLASSFHALWNMGKELPQLRFICEDDVVTSARMALLRSVGHVIASGLGILGVEALKEMK